MSWRDDAQRAAVCMALLTTVRQPGLWTKNGPTNTALAYMEAAGGPLSSGEAIMLHAAFGFWWGYNGAPIGELVSRLGGRPLAAVGELLVALSEGSTAIDTWIERWSQ